MNQATNVIGVSIGLTISNFSMCENHLAFERSFFQLTALITYAVLLKIQEKNQAK